MPELTMAELNYKRHLKVDLFPTIWCPGCGIGSIMMQLAIVLEEMGLDETNTAIVTGIGCTGRMGSYLKHESVYTLHGRTLPVAEAIKTFRPELNVIVVSGDGDLASIGGNHLIHTIRRNANLTVLCNNNEIYGLTGGQTGPTTPQGTKTLSSPIGNPNTPINLQGLVRSSPHALYAKTTVYHQQHLRTAISEAVRPRRIQLRGHHEPVHREQRAADRVRERERDAHLLSQDVQARAQGRHGARRARAGRAVSDRWSERR